MIYSLEGVVTIKKNDFIVLNVGGVGYQVYLTKTDLNKISLKETCFLYIHYLSNDSQTTLFGFLQEDVLDLFLLLTSVSGVGPRTAFTILDSGSPRDIIDAISNADASYFKKVKGVGPKLALKIIVEMQDKVGKIKDLNLSPLSEADEEIVQALCSLGFSQTQAREAVESLDPKLSEEDKIKQAIKLMSNNVK